MVPPAAPPPPPPPQRPRAFRQSSSPGRPFSSVLPAGGASPGAGIAGGSDRAGEPCNARGSRQHPGSGRARLPRRGRASIEHQIVRKLTTIDHVEISPPVVHAIVICPRPTLGKTRRTCARRQEETGAEGGGPRGALGGGRVHAHTSGWSRHGSSLAAGGGASFGGPRCCPICLFMVNIVRGSSKRFPRVSSRMMFRRSLGSCRSCSRM